MEEKSIVHANITVTVTPRVKGPAQYDKEFCGWLTQYAQAWSTEMSTFLSSQWNKHLDSHIEGGENERQPEENR